MKRILSTLNKKTGGHDDRPTPVSNTPEANAANGVKLFCESGGPAGGGDDVLHLPGIVDAAESSPSAAREAALRIRHYLSKEFLPRSHVQYNAVMLVRILADNPGPTFTRNLDGKFVAAYKDLLRLTHDPSLLQIARETLEALATEKQADENLAPMRELWAKEKERLGRSWGNQGSGQMPGQSGAAVDPNRQQNYFARPHRSKSLPAPHELAARIEEARTSAKLLLQVVQSTPSSELLNNDLIKEFAGRCQSASRSIQAYIDAENPAPDNDTLENLIDTNDELTKAMSKHQRAVLQARRALAAQETSHAAPVATAPALPGAAVAQPPLDPFRDDSPVSPQTLQAPLQPAIDGQDRPTAPSYDRYGAQDRIEGADEPYRPPVVPSQTHSQEPYHPGYGYSPTDRPAGMQQPQDATQEPLDYSRWSADADYYSATNRRTYDDGREAPTTTTHHNDSVVRAGAGNQQGPVTQ